jgi:hypothetical protein
MALCLQNCNVMKNKIAKTPPSGFGAAIALWLMALAFSLAGVSAPTAFSQADGRAAQDSSSSNPQLVAKFEGRVKEYARLREQLEEKLPKLPKDATPEQIKAHKTAFEEIVRSARAGAKQGDLFTPDIANYIRALIRNTFKGKKLQELREEILEAETQGVPLRVNYPYPESKELTQIPPTLLLKLPQLPKQVKYRFVGRSLLLVDRENTLIVDYMLDAFP